MTTLWVDYSGGEINADVLLHANVGGGIRYGGTPGRTKNMQPGDVAVALSAGLQQAVVYEDTAKDAEAGYNAGVGNALALLADCARCRVPVTTPLCAAADEHLTAAQVAVSVQYQLGFYRTVKASGWRGPVGAYGFSEFLTAVHKAGVADWFWQCGAWSAVDRTWVHLYQRNGSGGPTTNHAASGQVASVAVDFNDQLLPLPGASAPPPESDDEDDDVIIKCDYKQADGTVDTGRTGIYSGGFLSGVTPATRSSIDTDIAAGKVFPRWVDTAEWDDLDNKGNQLLRLLTQSNALLQQLTSAAGQSPVATVDAAALKAAIDQDVAGAVAANPLHLSGDVTIHPPTA